MLQGGFSFCAALDALHQGVHHMQEIKKSNDPEKRPEPQRFYGRPADSSFEAFKDFIVLMTDALGGENNLTEDELRLGWNRFWGGTDVDKQS
jgi:hypothetical protein